MGERQGGGVRGKQGREDKRPGASAGTGAESQGPAAWGEGEGEGAMGWGGGGDVFGEAGGGRGGRTRGLEPAQELAQDDGAQQP